MVAVVLVTPLVAVVGLLLVAYNIDVTPFAVIVAVPADEILPASVALVVVILVAAVVLSVGP